MTKVAKKVLILFTVLVMSLGILCACDKNEDKKELYTLEEAYEQGLLSVEDLQQIAYYMNNDIAFPEPLDEQTAQKIKEARAEYIRKRGYEEYHEDKVVTEGITIEQYNGNYNGCYIVWLTDIYSAMIMEPFYYDKNVVIGGVELHYHLVAFLHVWKES